MCIRDRAYPGKHFCGPGIKWREGKGGNHFMICSKFSLETRRYLCRFYQILDEMIAKMTGTELTCSISRNFIVQMIPHHEAAIQMSCNLLEYSDCAPVREIAQNIIEEQTKSIENMRDILDCCSMCSNSQRAVSYTHLDVYKRQILSRT